MTKATTSPQIEDVTSRFKSINPQDRIYRCERGYCIKVRVTDKTHTPARLDFVVTGSWADEATGKALVMDDFGPFVAGAHEVSIAAETEVDVSEKLEEARLFVVARTSLAAANHYAREALKGVRRASTL